MSAGTLTLTNDSDVVIGTGTDLSTELAAGDFTVVVVGGITYTLAVKSVDSATELTLASKYPGPSASGLAWNAVPRATQNQITAAVVAQATEALRGLNYDKQNWQQVFSNSSNITVKLPDGSTFSGPSWNKIAEIVGTLDIDSLQILSTQINKDAAQVAADKATVAAAAQQVATDKAAAANSASAASDSEGTATTKADEASDSAELARGWAINAEDVVVSGGQYSSYHWAQKAEKSAAEAASHNPNESLVKSLNLSDLADRAAAWLNVRPTGSTPLAADAVNDYDSPTLRQVRNMVGAGTAGPTMNGVMNFGVGESRLWLSRGYIPPYSLPQDGQIVNRADWPELWAHAQQHGAIADSAWIADPLKRALYSTGDGSTTFRLPDLNGVKKNGVDGFTGPDSLSALYGRGDGGVAAGSIIKNAAPNITGNFDIRFARSSGGSGAGIYLGGSGTVRGETLNTGGVAEPMQLASQGTQAFQRISIDASRSHESYGNYGEIRPNSFYGVWVVRASGGFVAANTSWSVINADTSLTGGANVATGKLTAQYKAAGKAYHDLSIDSSRVVGEDVSRAKLTVSSYLSSGAIVQSSEYYFGSHGVATFGGKGVILAGDFGIGSASGGTAPTNANNITNNGIWAGVGAGGTNWGNEYAALLHMSRLSSNSRGQLQIDPTGVVRVRGGNATTWYDWLVLQAQGTSGREYKRDITPADPREALDRIASQDLVTFVYKDDEQERVRFGIIAEDAEKIAPQYIKHDEETVEVDGEVTTRDHPRVDVNPIIMDLMGCVQALKAEIDLLKAQLSERTI